MASMTSGSNLGGPGGYSQQPFPPFPPPPGPKFSGSGMGGPGGYQQMPGPSVQINPSPQTGGFPPFPSMYGMSRPGPMPGNVMGPNPSVSIPGMYGAQQALTGTGMYSGQQQSQMSPAFLSALSMVGLSGLGGSTNPSQGNGTGGSAPYQGGGSGNASGGAQGGGGGQGGYGGSSSGMGPGGMGGSGPGSGGPSGAGYGSNGFGSFDPGNFGTRDWASGTIFDQSTNYGSRGGLWAAENGRLLGNLFGAATGLPGMGTVGNWAGNQYLNNNVFQNPANIPPSEFGRNLENMVNPYGQQDMANSSRGFSRFERNGGEMAAAANRGNATYGVGSWASNPEKWRMNRYGGRS